MASGRVPNTTMTFFFISWRLLTSEAGPPAGSRPGRWAGPALESAKTQAPAQADEAGGEFSSWATRDAGASTRRLITSSSRN